MLTLKVCLFLEFIYKQYKNKNKNILLIKQRKDKKKIKSLPPLNHNTYLLIY
jgi:hypothetical protein